jgi:hypothetical protein
MSRQSSDSAPRIPARPASSISNAASVTPKSGAVGSSPAQPPPPPTATANVIALPAKHRGSESGGKQPPPQQQQQLQPPPPPPPVLYEKEAAAIPVKQNGVGVSTAGVGYTQQSTMELAPLWDAVGLEVNGVHNYDPRSIELERVELEALHDEFLAHRKLFGFQADNVRNQMEHLCFLIQNARDRYGPAAYQYLHNRSVNPPPVLSHTNWFFSCLLICIASVCIFNSVSFPIIENGVPTSMHSVGVFKSV